jgi:hypothetical protein
LTKFQSIDCGHPKCTGVHSSRKGQPWSAVCPGYKERRNAQRRADWMPKPRKPFPCDHPQCTGNHSTGGTRENLCPAARERELARLTMRHQREREDPETFVNEVKVTPGRCIAWTALGGHCKNPAPDDIACEEHRDEFEHGELGQWRPRILTAEDYAMKAKLTPDEWERYRKKVYRQRKREQNPDYVPGEAPTAFAIRRAREVTIAKHADKLAKRREIILAKLREQGYVSTTEMCKELGVTSDTLKRFGRKLEAEGLAERIYGGMRLPGTAITVPVTRKVA